MKNNIILSILILALFLGSDATAGTDTGIIVYAPEAIAITIPAGSQGVTMTNINVINSKVSMYYLKAPTAMANGNLPATWIAAAQALRFFSPGTPVTTTLTISVPPGTPSGVYSGSLVSEARSVHGSAAPGAGLFIAVTVPPDCSGVPSFEYTSPDTLYLWPPDHSMEPVSVSGMVKMPQGCSLLETGYSIDDEYGEYTTIDTLSVNYDLSFTLTIPVEAWRDGKDKDGRHYSITLFARDEAGIGSSSAFTVIVPHDQRK